MDSTRGFETASIQLWNLFTASRFGINFACLHIMEDSKKTKTWS